MKVDKGSRKGWTRREFVRGAAGMVALPRVRYGFAARRSRGFAYVASGRGEVLVFALQGEAWSRIQSVPSRAPACILLSPAQRVLYVANEVETYEGLPRGTVEAFHIDAVNGRLTFAGRQALSLSATRPRHMALSPNGRLLAVAAYGGGLYNLFPIAEDGSLGKPNSILKQTGCGPDAELQASAHPHSLLFDATGRHLLGSDFGSDQLCVLRIENGRLMRQMQQSTGEGSGPGACALHPAGTLLYAWHDLEGALACYRYDWAYGRVGEAIQRLSFEGPCEGALGVHPSGRMLYTGQSTRNQLRAWHIHAQSGLLSHAQDFSLGDAKPAKIVVAPDGESIFVLDGEEGSIYKVNADRLTGELHCKAKVAVVKEPRSMALKMA